MLNLQRRISALVHLGNKIDIDADDWKAVMLKSKAENQWFTIDNQRLMIESIQKCYLSESELKRYVDVYTMGKQRLTIGLILAGNIPMVGFHDILSTFLSGHNAMIKTSDKDRYLIPFLIQKLIALEPETATYFTFVDKLENFDAIIATGSNNTARHFESYFKKYPKLIRKNRTAVAVLTGKESEEEMVQLGHDIFSYFGLGCRNVSKIYCLGTFDKNRFYKHIEGFKPLINHNKYKNNYDYNYAIYLLNKIEFFTDNVLIAKPDSSIHSRIASIHYEEMESIEEIQQSIEKVADEIQTVVSLKPLFDRHSRFGMAQKPSIDTFADGVDTMKFLTGLG